MFSFSRLDTLLPLAKQLERPRRYASFARAYLRLILVAFIIFTMLLFYVWHRPESLGQKFLTQALAHKDLPPLYERFMESERNLPQHDESLPLPEGKDARFLWFDNHVNSAGWGNAMQEMLLNAHLAYASNRAYVFDNYTWNRDGGDYSDYNGKKIPSRIPVSAILSGPIIGEPFRPGIDRPRAVSREYYKSLCPNATRVPTDELFKMLGDLSGPEYFARWTKKLLEMPDRCVEIPRDQEQIFSIWLFGDHQSTELFPEMKKAPVIQQLGWARLVREAYLTNQGLFKTPSTSRSFLALPPSHRPSIPGLLAVHIRRGDFADHCVHLTKWSSRFGGLGLLDGIPDRFTPPPGGGWGENTPENTEIYRKRCYPTVDELVEKIMAVRNGSAARDRNNTDSGFAATEPIESKGTEIRKIFVMTNGKQEWINEFKAKLEEKAEWDAIVSSRDLKLTPEQKYVAQAVDMYIGERAQEFIGNGFSTLSSNVVVLRMVHDYAPNTIHYW